MSLPPIDLTDSGIAKPVRSAILRLKGLDRFDPWHVPIELYCIDQEFDVKISVSLIPKIENNERIRQMLGGEK